MRSRTTTFIDTARLITRRSIRKKGLQATTGETTFGATHPEDEDPEQRNGKVDYYDVALRISQNKLLIGALSQRWDKRMTQCNVFCKLRDA